jgi:diguanylate cyclase (GGDEF)-like protein
MTPSVRSEVLRLATLVLEQVQVDPNHAHRTAQRLMGVARDSNDQEMMAIAHARLARTFTALDSYNFAIASWLEALSIFQSLNPVHFRGQVDCLNALGFIAQELADYADALSHFETALEIAKTSRDDELVARVSWSLGAVLSKLGHHKEALTFYRDALAIYKRLKHARGIAGVESNLALEYIEMYHQAFSTGDEARAKQSLTAASRSLHTAFEQAKALGDRSTMFAAFENSGYVLRLLGKHGEAVLAYEKQRARARLWKDADRLAEATFHLAETQLESHNPLIAKELFLEVIETIGELDRPEILGNCHLGLYRIFRQEADFEKALKHHELFHELGNRHKAVEAQRSAATFKARLDLQSERLRLEQERARAERLSLENADMSQKNAVLDQLAYMDSRTGLPNLRSFQDHLERLFKSAQARGNGLALIMLDLDRFKLVNDTHGHDVGDQVLAGLAGVLRATLRPSDFPARLGGEEFCIVLSEHSANQAVDVAERVRIAVEGFDWSQYAAGLACTASFGVIDTVLDSTKAMYKSVDDALYVAKATGRNRVVRWTEETPRKGA